MPQAQSCPYLWCEAGRRLRYSGWLGPRKNNETRERWGLVKACCIPAIAHEGNTLWMLVLGTQWSVRSNLTFQRLRACWGSQTSQSRSLMKHHSCCVGLADKSQGNWEETFYRWERRFRKDESAAWAEAGKIDENLTQWMSWDLIFSLLHYCSKQALYNSYGRPDYAGSREGTIHSSSQWHLAWGDCGHRMSSSGWSMRVTWASLRGQNDTD